MRAALTLILPIDCFPNDIRRSHPTPDSVAIHTPVSCPYAWLNFVQVPLNHEFGSLPDVVCSIYVPSIHIHVVKTNLPGHLASEEQLQPPPFSNRLCFFGISAASSSSGQGRVHHYVSK